MVSVPLYEAGVRLQCLLDANSDQNCACLMSGGGPVMNTDISGPGVRISFYLQALFFAWPSACSKFSLNDATGALYQLVSTNIAMIVTTFILGFKEQPEISLQDAIVVFYLLLLSWTTVMLSLPSYNRFVKSDRTIKYLSIVQSFLFFAFAFAILVSADNFGEAPLCNKHAVIVIFRPIPALRAGRVIAWIIVSIIFSAYSMLSLNDYSPLVRHWCYKVSQKRKTTRHGRGFVDIEAKAAYVNNKKKISKNTRKKKGPRNGDRPEDEKEAGSSKFVLRLILILVIWALAIMNIELLILWNNFAEGGTQWQFGQILAMFLLIVPVICMVQFIRFNLYARSGNLNQRRRRRKRRNTRKKSVERRHAYMYSSQYGRKEHDGAKDFLVASFEGIKNSFGEPLSTVSSFSDVYPVGDMHTARISDHSIHDPEESACSDLEGKSDPSSVSCPP